MTVTEAIQKIKQLLAADTAVEVVSDQPAEAPVAEEVVETPEAPTAETTEEAPVELAAFPPAADPASPSAPAADPNAAPAAPPAPAVEDRLASIEEAIGQIMQRLDQMSGVPAQMSSHDQSIGRVSEAINSLVDIVAQLSALPSVEPTPSHDNVGLPKKRTDHIGSIADNIALAKQSFNIKK